MKDSITIYDNLSHPPKSALKPIVGGKMRGKTDINPQWRYRAMTEQFGLCGIGWRYEIRRLWTEDGANGEKLAFAEVAVFVKDGDVWSDAIVGVGGSCLVTTEKGVLVSNDEGYKMAITDAFSTALKMIGVAAAIYAGAWDGSKYNDNVVETKAQPVQPQPQKEPQPQQNPQPQQPQQAQKAETVYADGKSSTEEQKKRLHELIAAKYNNGQAVFSKDERHLYLQYSATMTAWQLIAFIENALRTRNAYARELPENKV